MAVNKQNNTQKYDPDDAETPDVPEWLLELLNKTPKTDVPTKKELKALAASALEAKSSDVENKNLVLPKRLWKRSPDNLTKGEIAAIIHHVFEFRDVSTTGQDNGELMVYIPSTDDIWRKASPSEAVDGKTNVGIYISHQKFMYRLVKAIYLGGESTRDFDAILSLVKAHADEAPVETTPHAVVVNNGIRNMLTKELEPFTPERVFITKSGTDWVDSPTNPVIPNPDGTMWDVESWLTELAISPEVYELFWQIISASLQGNRNMKKSIWFYSKEGNNGKGTLGKLIRNLVGDGNHSSINVEQFGQDFMLEDLLRAVVNIADENNVNTYLDTVHAYKASITGDPIRINRKHKTVITSCFLGLNIQMMNGIPKTKDKTDSFYRRLIIVPFLKSFTNNGERTYIKDDYISRKDVLEHVLHKALSLDFDEFIVPAESLEAMGEYQKNNNPVQDFWEEMRERLRWDLVPKSFLLDLYKKWLEETNPSIAGTVSRNKFYEELNSVVHKDPDWKVTNGAHHTGKLMIEDEPLITSYGLDRLKRNGNKSPWRHLKAKEDDDDVFRRTFIRAANYDGYLRL